MIEILEHYGVSFTRTLHDYPEGHTLPENNKSPAGSPFVVVVTGAGKGVSYAMAVAYAKAGATGICISSRTQITLNRIVENMANDHGKEGLLAYTVHPGEVVTPMTQHNSLSKVLQTDVNLAGGFLTWLTNKRRDWLNGRYLSVHWDVDELEKKKDEIVHGDKLKFKMVI